MKATREAALLVERTFEQALPVARVYLEEVTPLYDVSFEDAVLHFGVATVRLDELDPVAVCLFDAIDFASGSKVATEFLFFCQL